jgi:YVTN family beta-propeller protein/VCBS repeat-containing protein
VTASNGTFTSSAGSISVPITAISDTPTAPVSASQSTNAAGVVTGTLTATDPAGKTLTYTATATGGPADGTVTVSSAGDYTYTPTALAQEQASVGGPTADSFTVTATNGTFTSAAGTISVPITAISDTPTAPVSASQSTNAAGVVTGTLTATDPAGKTLTYTAVSTGGPADGSVTVNSAGDYTYTPSTTAQEAASVGGPTADSFTVTATNGTYTSAAGTISVPITAISDTPTVPVSASQSTNAAGVVTGTLTATDPAGKTLTYNATSNPADGTVTVTTAGVYSYTPTTLAQEQASVGGASTDSFTVTATNGTYTSAAGTISVPITPVADTPTAPVRATSNLVDLSTGVVTSTLSSTDPAGQALSYTATTNPADGTVTVNAATGAYTYTPTTLARVQASDGGPTTDSFTATASNGVYTSAAGTITVPILQRLDAPTAPAIVGTPTTDPTTGVVTGTLGATDPAGLPLTYAAASNPADGTVTVNSAGAYTYTPTTAARIAASDGGPTTDSFTATANNGVDSGPAGTITVPISALTDVPTAPATVGTPTVNPTTGVVTGTLGATDPGGLLLTYTATTSPADGTVTVNSAGDYTYTPTQAARVEAANGGPITDSFTATASNGLKSGPAGTITVPISSAVPTVTAAVGVGTEPIGVAVSPNGTTAYVANDGSNTVSVINTATNTVAATIAVGADPYDVAVNPNGNLAYVTNLGAGTVSVIDTNPTSPTYDTVTANIPVADPVGVAVSPNGSLVYVTTQAGVDGPTVAVINTATNTVTATIPVSTTPYFVAVSPNGDNVYVTNYGNSTRGAGTLSVIDTNPASPTYDTVTATIAVGRLPQGVAVSPNGSFVYVTNEDSGTVSVINTASNAVTATIPVGSAPFGVALSPDGSLAYVTNAGAGTVSVINTATNAVITTVPVFGPAGVAVSPDGSVYVANPGNPLLVISIGSAAPDVPIAGTPTTGTTDLTTGVVTGNSKFIDSAGNTLSYSVTTSPTQGTVTVNSATGAYTYTPTAADRPAPLSPNGADSFVVSASNGVNSTPETITVAVIPAVPPTTNIAVGDGPDALAVSPDGKSVYVVNGGDGVNDGTVSVINASTDTVAKTITVGVDPDAIAVSPNGKTIYVVNEGVTENAVGGPGSPATVSVINASTNTVTKTISVGANNYFAGWVAVSPDGSTVYVTDENINTELEQLTEINTSTNAVTNTVALPEGTGNGLVESPDGKTLYLGGNEDGLAGADDAKVFNTSTNTVTTTALELGLSFGTTAISADGSTIYFGNADGETVEVVNTSTDTITATVPVSSNENAYPDGIAVSPDGSTVYVGDGEVGNDDFFVINTSTDSVTAVPVGGTAGAVAVSPDGKTVYVADVDTDTVSAVTVD